MEQDDLKKLAAELKALRGDVAKLRGPAPQLLNIDAVARMLGLSPKTIRNGLGPRAAKPFPIKPVKVAGRVLFRLKDLQTFIDGLGVRS